VEVDAVCGPASEVVAVCDTELTAAVSEVEASATVAFSFSSTFDSTLGPFFFDLNGLFLKKFSFI